MNETEKKPENNDEVGTPVQLAAEVKLKAVLKGAQELEADGFPKAARNMRRRNIPGINKTFRRG